jgi:ATP-dependent helicase/nuclease subunit A
VEWKQLTSEETTAAEQPPPATDPDISRLLTEIDLRLAYTYPYAALTQIPVKRGVSELTERVQNEKFAFASKPAFIRENSVSAAQKGIAMHTFLQFADYRAAATNLEEEIVRLTGLGFLSERDAAVLERKKLQAFLSGSFAARMLRAEKVYREQKFTMRVPVGEFAKIDGSFNGESVVVQGIVDCAFEENGALVLLDYKTDRVADEEELALRYAEQLAMYRRAMELCFGLHVREVALYSFWFGKVIDLSFVK